ncbi:MAG: hypothetical protein MPK62_09565, partial [Alphaproteobacteria bacterium]|nr:hypothetical protein [Alphaproteobacteria bacterium]
DVYKRQDGDRNGDGESPIKSKALIDLVIVVCLLIKETKFNFLRAAPAGISGCGSLEPTP